MISPVPPRGATGATGPAGATGATGPAGADGPPVRVIVFSQGLTGASETWTNMPAATTEFLSDSNRRANVDLSGTVEARLSLRTGGVAAPANAKLAVQYSTDSGSTWAYLDGSAGPSCLCDATTTNAVGSWVTVAAGAKTDTLLRIVGAGGNGTADPIFTRIQLETR